MNASNKARLGFYTTVILEGEDEGEAEERAIALLRDNQEFASSILNEKTDSPMMLVEEIAELESFPT